MNNSIKMQLHCALT